MVPSLSSSLPFLLRISPQRHHNVQGEPSLQWLHFIDAQQFDRATRNLMDLADKEDHARREKVLRDGDGAA